MTSFNASLTLVAIVAGSVLVADGGQSSIDRSRIAVIAHCSEQTAYGVIGQELNLAGPLGSNRGGSNHPSAGPTGVAAEVLAIVDGHYGKTCPRSSKMAYEQVTVYVLRGDPSTFIADRFNLGIVPFTQSYRDSTYAKIQGEYGKHVMRARAYKNGETRKWNEYTNLDQEAKESAARKAADEQQIATMKADRAAEAARRVDLQNQAESERTARSASFVKSYGVQRFVTAEELAANPFVYKGTVVAVYGHFDGMTSPTLATFSSAAATFQVSGIPAGRFTRPRSMVMLAGRVIGNVEIKLPVVGAMLVPHLTFVGSAFCQEQGCRDFSIVTK